MIDISSKERIWPFLLILFIRFFQGQAALQTGFSLHLRNVQKTQSKGLTTVGPWETEPKTGLGDYLTGFMFDSLRLTAIIPTSGIYFVSVKIHISGASSHTTCAVMSSLSGQSLVAWIGNDFEGQDEEVFLSGSLHLSIGEKIKVVIKSDKAGLMINKDSLFSMYFQGPYGLLPSFLASPARTEKYKSGDAFRIASWKVHHRSSTSFSSATGTFVAANSASYLCSLNLLVENAFGIIRVEFRTNSGILFSLDKKFLKKISTAIYFSKIFSLMKNEMISLWLQPLNDSLVVSSSSSYSCVLAGKQEHSICLDIQNATTINHDNAIWKETTFWKKKQQSGDLSFFPGEGKIFIDESIALVSVSLSIMSTKSTVISTALLSGGVAERISPNDGIIKTLKLPAGSRETLTLTGVLKASGDSYISIFLKSSTSSTVHIVTAEAKVILHRPLAPSIGASLSNGAQVGNYTKNETSWSTLFINKNKDFEAQPEHWYTSKTYFSPKNNGIYYISINLIIEILKNATQNSLIEAKLVAKSSGETLHHVTRGVGGISNTISLISTFLLQADEKLSILFRCEINVHCITAKSSGFSAVLIAQTFRAEGFSTILNAAKSISFRDRFVISGWKTSGSNYMITNSFNARKGEYLAAYSGIYMITCSVSIRNMSKSDIIKIQLKTGDESKLFIEDRGQQKVQYKEGDYGITLSIASSVSLQKGQAVSLRLVRIAKQQVTLLRNYLLMNTSTFAIAAITQSGLPVPSGFTMSLMRSVLGLRGQTLQRWTTYRRNGAFNARKRSLFQFLEQQGTISFYKQAILLLTISAQIKTSETQRFALDVNLDDNRAISTSYDVLPKSKESTMKLSVVLFVQANQRLSVKIGTVASPAYSLSVDDGRSHIGKRFTIMSNTVISAVFLSEIPSKPGLMLAIKGYKTMLQKEWRIYQFGFSSSAVGYYKQNIVYNIDDGSFEIPFSGNYFISLNLEIARTPENSSSICGLFQNKDAKMISLATSELQNTNSQFELARILEFKEPAKVLFACQSNGKELKIKKDSYMMLTLLEYPKIEPTKSIEYKEKWIEVEKKTSINASHKLKESGTYLLAVNTKRQLSSYTVTHEGKAVLDVNVVSPTSKNTLFFALNLQSESAIHLLWFEDQKHTPKERIGIYKITNRLGGLSLSVNKNALLLSRNISWALIPNWGNHLLLDFMYTKSSYFNAGLFISKEDGKYLITAILNFAAEKQKKRDVHLVVDGIFSPDSPSIPVCQTASNAMCTVAITATLHLQKWQSLGVYIHFAAFDDEVRILKGSRLTILLLDVGVRTYVDNGPNVVTQPWPTYVNKSKVFNWSCDAVGSKDLSYSWKRTSLETNTESVVSKGKTVTIYGRPEESGFYFCSVEMNGTVHNSQVATLNVSDTDECTTNITELKHSCHKDAYCINTIGSYDCECKTGFRGNGFQICSDINECLVNTTCHSMALCENTVGSHKCRCKKGYTGNGKMCEDINECLMPNSCHKDSDCINTDGSYECNCRQGYTGNGFNCENINECLLDDTEYPCHQSADCTDLTGSFYCTCWKGWSGNGTYCEDINECETMNCTGNATCYNSPGSFRCKCNQGFRGDPYNHCESLGCTPPPYCSGEFKAAWWARSPYLANSSSQEPIGLFKDLLTQVVISCCDNCSLLSFVGPYNGSFDVETAMEANSTVDFGCPLYGSPDQTLFRGFPFMPVVEAPGIAFFVKDQPKEKSAVLGSLGSSWPILAITFLLACLSGIIIWFLDTVRNPTEFPNSFIGGSWEGFWWAFITMTTVGYGDKAPRSFAARLFGIIWILIGLVIISTFTATITTMLTANSLSDEIKLYGMKVGVLHNSEEYRLGVKRNAETKSFGSVAEIVKNVEDGTVQGILLDAYIAGEYQDQLSGLRLHQVIDYVFSYGVVLSRDGLAMRQCFNHFLESKQSQIYSTISKVIKPLKQTKASASLAAQKSANIFDSDSIQFKYTLYGGLGLFCFLFMIGIIWEYLNSRTRKRRYSIAETEEPLEPELMEWKVHWDSGKVSHFHRNIFRNEISDLKHHIREFADSWISRLDELESKQASEVSMMKNNTSRGIAEKSQAYRIGKMSMKCSKDDKRNQNHIEMMPK